MRAVLTPGIYGMLGKQQTSGYPPALTYKRKRISRTKAKSAAAAPHVLLTDIRPKFLKATLASSEVRSIAVGELSHKGIFAAGPRCRRQIHTSHKDSVLKSAVEKALFINFSESIRMDLCAIKNTLVLIASLSPWSLFLRDNGWPVLLPTNHEANRAKYIPLHAKGTI